MVATDDQLVLRDLYSSLCGLLAAGMTWEELRPIVEAHKSTSCKGILRAPPSAVSNLHDEKRVAVETS